MIKKISFSLFLFSFFFLLCFSSSADYVSSSWKGAFEQESSDISEIYSNYIPTVDYCSVDVTGYFIVVSNLNGVSNLDLTSSPYALIGSQKIPISYFKIGTFPSQFFSPSSYISFTTRSKNSSSINSFFNGSFFDIYSFSYTIPNFKMSSGSSFFGQTVFNNSVGFSQMVSYSICDDIVFPTINNSSYHRFFYLIDGFTINNFYPNNISRDFTYGYLFSLGFMSNFNQSYEPTFDCVCNYSYQGIDYSYEQNSFYEYQSNAYLLLEPRCDYYVSINSFSFSFYINTNPTSPLFASSCFVPNVATISSLNNSQNTYFAYDNFPCYLTYVCFNTTTPYEQPPNTSGSSSDINYSDYQRPKENWYDFGTDLYNMFIWLIFEFPLLSFITKPFFLLINSLGSVISTFAIPIVFSTTFFGSLLLFVFITKFIKHLMR